MLRPLILEFQNDPGSATAKTEFMFGERSAGRARHLAAHHGAAGLFSAGQLDQLRRRF
jgi:hypothetical protein